MLTMQIPDDLWERIKVAADRAETPATIWVQHSLAEACDQSDLATWASPDSDPAAAGSAAAATPETEIQERN